MSILRSPGQKPSDDERRRPGFSNPWVLCGCGCGEWLPKFDKTGRRQRYVAGHEDREVA